MRTLKEISHDSYYKMENYHQITVDFIEEVEDLFDNKPGDNSEKIDLISRLQALSYKIHVCLEIFNPEFKVEIADLTDLQSLIEIRVGYIESLDFKK